MPSEAIISSRISKGTVLFWRGYEFFETGETKDSLFLILSSCVNNSYLAIRATTQTEFYEKQNSSLTREFILIKPKQERAFSQKTVFDFARIKTLHFEHIKERWNDGVEKTSPVSGELLSEIDKRLNHSKIVRKDWIEWIRTSEPVS